jgi:uncharacterized membrane protein YkvI
MGAMSDPATLRRGAILGGVGLAVCASALNLAILTQVPQAALQEIPMLYIVSKVVAHAPFVYAVLLLAEIYTTAVANLYALAARIAPPNTSKFTMVSIAAAIIALLGSQVGFAQLVKVLYSGMGFMGVLVLSSLTWWWWRNRGIITARGR